MNSNKEFQYAKIPKTWNSPNKGPFGDWVGECVEEGGVGQVGGLNVIGLVVMF